MFWLLTMSRKHTILDNRTGNRKRLCCESGRLIRSRFYEGQYLPLRRSSRRPGGAVTEESLYISPIGSSVVAVVWDSSVLYYNGINGFCIGFYPLFVHANVVFL